MNPIQIHSVFLEEHLFIEITINQQNIFLKPKVQYLQIFTAHTLGHFIYNENNVICKVILKCSNSFFLFHAKIDFISINLFCFCSNDIPRKVWPRAKELMQQRPSTRLDFKESFDLQSTTSNANKKFDLRDGKVEVWLFVASAIFGAVFSLMIFQLLRLLRVHCLTFKPASCCHGEPQKAIDKVILAQFYSYFNYYFIIILTFWSFF